MTIRDLETLGRWRTTAELPAIVPGRWHDMVFHVRFDRHDGLVEAWMDGEPVVRDAGPTASSEGIERFYHKVGLYRDRMPEPMTIYVDCYALGTSFDEVDPARFDAHAGESAPR